MHPAISVIFFTVTSGAGFGLIALIGLGWPARPGILPVFLICLAGGGLATAGLVASTLHLGHPERAWRALSQWRSSWLSREGIAAIATLVLFALYALIWMITGVRSAGLGVIAALGAAVTVFTTSMIYAQLKTVPQWRSAFTPACYMGFSLASGWLFASAFGAAPILAGFSLAAIGLALVMASWGLKFACWRHAAHARLSTGASSPETATGLGFLGTVRLLESPHSGESYLTREMVHQIGRKHARILRRIAVIFGALVPSVLLLLIWITQAHQGWIGLAGLSLMAGLCVERWLFFAEAEHSVSLYYKER